MPKPKKSKPKLKYIPIKPIGKEKQAEINRAFDILFEDVLRQKD